MAEKIKSKKITKRFVVDVTFDPDAMRENYHFAIPVRAGDLAKSLVGETTADALESRGYEVKIISEGTLV